MLGGLSPVFVGRARGLVFEGEQETRLYILTPISRWELSAAVEQHLTFILVDLNGANVKV
jgi:hypothetical protein